MTTFDVEAAMNGLAQLIRTIPAIESVGIGQPESLTHRISAWVTVGDPGEIGPRTTGVYDLDMSLICWFGYEVGGAEGAAEAMLGDFISELTRRMIQNRAATVTGNSVTVTRNLNGSVTRMGLPQAAAGMSEYALFAGAEARVYPMGIRVIQQENLGV